MKDIFRILKTGRELWKSYILIAVLNTLLSAASIVTPLFSGWAIDEMRLGTDANVRYVTILAVSIFLIDVLQTLVSNVNGYIGDQVSGKLQHVLSSRYYAHVLSLPQAYFDNELSGKIIGRLNRSIVQITSFVQMMSNNFLQFVISTVLSLVAVAYYSPEVAFMLFLLYPIFTWMTVKSSGKWQVWQKEKNEYLDTANGRFTESISQVRVVKSYLQQKRELSFFNTYMKKTLKVIKPQSAYWHKQDVHRRLILNAIFFGVYMYIFVRGAQGVYTPGQAVALLLYAMNIRIPIFTISWLVENTQRAVADSADYFEIMQEAVEPHGSRAMKSLTIKKGEVNFSQIVFGYDASKTVLKNVSFTADAHAKLALVGESGEGKTTLTNLLLGFYEPNSGTISIDGQSLDTVSKESIREQIAVVFQEPALFSGTIEENISYAKPGASLESVIAAAKSANAHEFITKLSEGYKTQIGERGLKLSGGQKQRIAIARALLKDAPILVLDEATSSLDSKSESMVQEALARLMKNRTTIIIAHRLSTIQHVDKIVTLRNGMVDEIGTPSDLAKSGGIYSQLLALQYGDDETSKKKLQKYEITMK